MGEVQKYIKPELLRATKERDIYKRVDQFHHCPLLATHICFVYCFITAVQNVRIDYNFPDHMQ